ncbi:MAG: elongation factor Ts, partial [Pseudomonadota bacterium]|nr:elongation factor Ts [Pseudomonadota bacterium]
MGQEFIKDPDLTVAKLLEKSGSSVVSFTRYEVGEGVEVEEVNFADEVKAQVDAVN